MLIITAKVHDSQNRVIKVQINGVNRETSEIYEIIRSGADDASVQFEGNLYPVEWVDLATGGGYLRTRAGAPEGAALDELPAAPMTMAVFGDSIAWGLGLKKEQKASTLIANKISKKNEGVGVRVLNLANSGGIISVEASQRTGYRVTLDAADENRIGEVSDTSISVFSQMVAFDNLANPVAPEKIDFIYLCAGINDIGVKTILSFLKQDSELEAAVDEKIGQRLPDLLASLMAKFPNARILVAGYFPIITRDSHPHNIQELALSIQYMTNSKPSVPAVFGGAARNNLILNCNAFWDRATSVIRNTVETINAANPRRARVFFGTPDFERGHVLFTAPKVTRLFHLNGLGHTTDDMRQARTVVCKIAWKNKRNAAASTVACECASIGHPNPKGAKLYCRAFRDAL